MEALVFSETEIADLRKRAMERAEARLTEELLQQLRTSVVRDLVAKMHRNILPTVEKLIYNYLTDARIEDLIAKELGRAAQYNSDYIRKALDAAVFRVVDNHAKSVADAMKEMVYLALKNNFYEKKEEKKDG